MVNLLLGILGGIAGLLIFYIRVISVVIDEQTGIENEQEFINRHRKSVKLSMFLERIWPIVQPWTPPGWQRLLAFSSTIVTLLIFAFALFFKDYFTDYAGTLLVLLFFTSSLSSGPNSLKHYHKIKPYVHIILPALVYMGLTMMETSHPNHIVALTFPGLTFEQSKLIAAALAFAMAFILPYPIAKFDAVFSSLIASSTLYFLKDLLRLGIKPSSENDIKYRKIAKETVSFALKVILVVIAIILYFKKSSG
ncbi:hypothetical protein ACYZT8_16665 [Pseudomonas sp. LB3P93]